MASTDILESRIADGQYKADIIYDITPFNLKTMSQTEKLNSQSSKLKILNNFQYIAALAMYRSTTKKAFHHHSKCEVNFQIYCQHHDNTYNN